MKLKLYSKALRNRYGAESIEDAVEVPDQEAKGFLEAGVAAPAKGGAKPEVATAPEAEERNWDLKLSPEEYLERYPDGPNSDLAREIIEG